MHQCDYCCWYVNDMSGCECPWAMRARACDAALRRKEQAEGILPSKK